MWERDQEEYSHENIKKLIEDYFDTYCDVKERGRGLSTERAAVHLATCAWLDGHDNAFEKLDRNKIARSIKKWYCL